MVNYMNEFWLWFLYTILIIGGGLLVLFVLCLCIFKIKERIHFKKVEYFQRNPIEFSTLEDTVESLAHIVKVFNSIPSVVDFQKFKYVAACIEYLSLLYDNGEIFIHSGIDDFNHARECIRSNKVITDASFVFYDKAGNYYYISVFHHGIPIFKKINLKRHELINRIREKFYSIFLKH